MKTTIQYSLSFLFLILTISVQSQDTLCFYSKEKIAVKLDAIEINEVKYRRFDNLNGPSYIVSKDKLSFIKYSNGLVDSLAKQRQIAVAHKQLLSSDKEGVLNVRSGKVSLDGRTVSDAHLKFLINNYSNPEVKIAMQRKYREMKQHEITQKVFTPLGFVAGFAIPLGTSLSAIDESFYGRSGNNTGTIFIGGIIIGAAVRITSCVIHNVAKNKRHHTKKEIAILYNQNL